MGGYFLTYTYNDTIGTVRFNHDGRPCGSRVDTLSVRKPLHIHHSVRQLIHLNKCLVKWYRPVHANNHVISRNVVYH